ncbi:hypothetical protein GT347_24795 [Xylophilus rhododendri]|uniref:Uncharacterized protein n=1 Tax=Xylophilus rhododendri TaxID=2697032 RepID=A0A857JCI8_9BURK|nr:hypothetical protein [Xylophilus rhododendri]QHJ00924.1 hypothetical protein GT347_24795 [Xylophilus rhododendri]
MSSNIYESLVGALRAHWTAHGNQNPRKLIIGSTQYRELMELRQTGRTALGDVPPPEKDSFLGVALEIDDGSPGAIVGIDGQTTPLPNTTTAA